MPLNKPLFDEIKQQLRLLPHRLDMSQWYEYVDPEGVTFRADDLLDPKTGRFLYSKEQLRAMVSASVGEGHARFYVAFMDLYKDMDPIPFVISNPHTAKVYDRMDLQYVCVAALARYATLANWKAICTYLKRLSKEMQLICVNSAVRKTPELKHTAQYVELAVGTAELVS